MYDARKINQIIVQWPILVLLAYSYILPINWKFFPIPASFDTNNLQCMCNARKIKS